jgi:hypothetical protein
MHNVFGRIILAYHRDISVLVGMGYGLDVSGLLTDRGKRLFSNPHSIQAGSGAHTFSYLMGIGGHFRGGKTSRA